MANRWEKMETVVDFIFLGSKVTVDGECSHLFLGKKTMTSLDSILKSRDIPLLTKVCIMKGMVFPAVLYGCESWTTKCEHLRTDAFELWSWRRLLRVSWTARRSNQSIQKEINPDYSLKEWYWSWSSNMTTWCKEPTHWKRPWCWERLRVGGEEDNREWNDCMVSLK